MSEISPAGLANDARSAWARRLRRLCPPYGYYLIVDPTEPLILHHTRATGETILTRIVREGTIRLDPPGLELALADVYADVSP